MDFGGNTSRVTVGQHVIFAGSQHRHLLAVLKYHPLASVVI